MSAGASWRQQRSLEVKPGGLGPRRARLPVVDRGERGRDGPVARGAGADHRRQEGRHPGRRQARRQPAQRRRVAPDFEPEPAIALQVDEPGRHDLGVEPRPRQLTDVVGSDFHDPISVDDQGAGHQAPVEEQSPRHGVSVVAVGRFCFHLAALSYVATHPETACACS